ncbi:MAG: Lrp/AsnC family transcriptional regulator [Candidatus Nitrosomaritimum yanchengensis]
MDFDEKDEKILKHLLVDARQSARQLAHKLNVSTVTMISRIKKLEQKKIIEGYTVRLNHGALGYDITGIIEVTTTKGKMVEIEDEIAKTENVCAVYDITGTADIMVVGKFNNQIFKESIKHNKFLKYRNQSCSKHSKRRLSLYLIF